MKDVNEHLEQAIIGTPQIKPEERKKYLGQLKERLYLSATFSDCHTNHFLTNLETIIQDKQATLYINSQLPTNLQNQLIQLALNYHRQFTVITTQDIPKKDTIGLVYADSIATHVSNCAYDAQFIPGQTKVPQQSKKNSSIWDKLFHHH